MRFYNLVLALSIGAALVSTGAQAQQPLSIGVYSIKPHVWVDKGKPTGMDSDLVAELFHRLGLPFEIKEYPFKRAMHNLQKGKVDLLFTAFKTPEREAFALYPRVPLGYAPYSLFVPRDSRFKYEKLEDLSGKVIGKGLGYSAGPFFDQAIKSGIFTLEESSTDIGNFKKLLEGRTDAVAQSFYHGHYLLQQTGLADKIMSLPKHLGEPIPYYLIISKASDAVVDKASLVKRIDRTLQAMEQDGTRQKIISRYVDAAIARE
ncbi:MAG: substrate-binding periplasmic protein [Pseudomonadales bacterium]